MFTRLSALLPSALRRHGVEHDVAARQVLASVDAFLQHAEQPTTARGVRFARGLITIEVEHPAAAAVIHRSRQALLRHLKTALPHVTVRDVRFTARR